MHENFLIYRHARATMMQKTQDYLIIVFLITGKIIRDSYEKQNE